VRGTPSAATVYPPRCSEGRKRGQPPATSGPRSRCRRRQPGQL